MKNKLVFQGALWLTALELACIALIAVYAFTTSGGLSTEGVIIGLSMLFFLALINMVLLLFSPKERGYYWILILNLLLMTISFLPVLIILRAII